MIMEILSVGALIHTFASVDKAMKLDEKALDKYSKAFTREEEAQELILRKEELADARIKNVAKKKRAIINNTLPRFVQVYSQIQKIDISLKDRENEISFLIASKEYSKKYSVGLSIKKDFTDKELVCGYLFRGLGTIIKKDSESLLSAANNQVSAANIAYSQAESIAEVYDLVITRADRISNLLMTMNALFIKSIQETERTISNKGIGVGEYDEYDKGVLMTCVNIAVAMSDIMDIPVVDENGNITKAAEEMLLSGESYLAKMNGLINS